MTAISQSRVILIDNYVPLSMFTVVDWSPVLMIIPNNPANTTYIYEKLSNAHPNLTVFLKNNITERFLFALPPGQNNKSPTELLSSSISLSL